MGAIEILKKDHQEIKDLLALIANSSPTALKTREKSIHKLEKLLSLHTEIEEKWLYPIGLKDTALENTIHSAYEEHNAVDMLIKKVLKVEVNDEYWLAKCSVIKENVEHHIKEEEDKVFPNLVKKLSKEDLEHIGAEILKFKEKYIIKNS